MSRREEESREPRRTADELSDVHIRRMLRPGDRDRERPRRKGLTDGLRVLFVTLGRHPCWTVLGVLVVGLSIVATTWQVLPRDKNSELLDALTRREHELIDQRGRATSPGEIALIDADLEQVRKKTSEVIDRMSHGEDPTSTPEPDPAPPRDVAFVAEEERVPEEGAREPLDAEGDAPSSGSAAGAQRRPRPGDPLGYLPGSGEESPEDPSGGDTFPKGKTPTRTASRAPTEGPVLTPGAPDAPRGPAVPQRESWIHNGVLRLTLETTPLRGERPRDIVRRHRELVNELQRWLPGE